MAEQFTGKVVLITGGGSGIGRNTALAFARAGATVVVAGRNLQRLGQTIKMIEAAGGNAAGVATDVTRAGDVARLVDIVASQHGALDIAFNNAGSFGTPSPLADVGCTEWSTVLATNLTGVWLCMKYEIAHMRAHGGGIIVNTASNIGTHRRMPSMGAYAATKAGVSTLTRAAALEYTGAGIRINAVSPGPVDTGWFQAPDGAAQGENAGWDPGAGLPIGRVATMDEISNAVLWLASPEASFVVGHDLVIDGGASS